MTMCRFGLRNMNRRLKNRSRKNPLLLNGKRISKMAKYIAESKWIYSIWPGKLEPIKLYHGPDPNPLSGRCTTYWIPPVPPRGPASKPKGIEVADAFENVLNPMEE